MTHPITYSQVCEASTPEDMQILFEAMLLELCADHDVDPDEIRPVQLSNVGYIAGYYDAETLARVRTWLGAGHPIFG